MVSWPCYYIAFWCVLVTYISDDPAGSDTVIEAHPPLVVSVFSWADDVLVSHVVGTLVQDPPATLYPHRVASVEEAMQVSWVPFAVIGPALEVLVLKKHNLKRRIHRQTHLTFLFLTSDLQECVRLITTGIEYTLTTLTFSISSSKHSSYKHSRQHCSSSPCKYTLYMWQRQ